MSERKRVLVVGGGAAGVACAWSLARFPEKFAVSLWERNEQLGGVATSADLSGRETFINDGVQGTCPSYRNLNMLHELFGFASKEVHMTVSFGRNDRHWTNYSTTPLVKRLAPEIRRFGKVLKWVHRGEPLTVMIPIARLLKWFRFSEEFRNSMVFPLVALFFGTGNRTPYVSAAVIARVFLDPKLRLFDYDPERLLSQQPEMGAFERLGEIYDTIAKKGGFSVSTERGVRKVHRHAKGVDVTDESGTTESFDEIVFACDAENALRVLERPSRMEKMCLGNVKYYNDVTVTHDDLEYMQRHYEVDVERDMYFVRTDPEDHARIEMSFNLSNYQPQLKSGDPNPVFQTIFLDDSMRQSWTTGAINPKKVHLCKWWRQFAHEWTHFASVVPLVRFIEGRRHTWYCGAYTLVNTHELATISGLAIADRLGAPYPFTKNGRNSKIRGRSAACLSIRRVSGVCPNRYTHNRFPNPIGAAPRNAEDDLACEQFDLYMEMVQGSRRSNKAKEAVWKRVGKTSLTVTGALLGFPIVIAVAALALPFVGLRKIGGKLFTRRARGKAPPRKGVQNGDPDQLSSLLQATRE